MPTETTLFALSATDLAIIGALATLCGLLGWQMQRMTARGREAALKRSLLEAKGAVPQLETAVRNHEQRASALQLEVKALQGQLSDLEASARAKETEIARRDREIRTLSSELTILKDGTSSGQVLLDVDDTPAEPSAADPEMAKRQAALEARYEALKRGLIQRDDRIAELEEQLRNPDNEVPTRTLEHQLAELEQASRALEARLEEREAQLDGLQTRLQEEVAQRESLEDLARRRSEGNRELKAAAAKHEQQLPALLATIKSRNADLARRDDKLQALTRALAGERQQREAREVEVKDLQAQLAADAARQRDLQQRLREHDATHRALHAELSDTRDTLRATEAAVRERDAAVAQAEQRMAEASGHIKARERTLASLQGTIKDRDFRIAGLEAAARQQSAKLEMLRATFFEAKTAHKAQLESLERRLAERDQTLAMQETEGRARADELATLRSERDTALESLARAEARTTQLQCATAELAQANQAADALRHQVMDLSEALARSHATLGQRQSTIMLLVARLGAPPLLLPAPAAVGAAPAATFRAGVGAASRPRPSEPVMAGSDRVVAIPEVAAGRPLLQTRRRRTPTGQSPAPPARRPARSRR